MLQCIAFSAFQFRHCKPSLLRSRGPVTLCCVASNGIMLKRKAVSAPVSIGSNLSKRRGSTLPKEEKEKDVIMDEADINNNREGESVHKSVKKNLRRAASSSATIAATTSTTPNTSTTPKTKRKKKVPLDELDVPVGRRHVAYRARGQRWVGCHVSATGGVQHAVINALQCGANSFALFLKSQRQWASKPLEQTDIDMFKLLCAKYGYGPNHILPHGSYLVNLGNPDKEKREKSYEAFLDDIRRCEQLSIGLYNFHPGSTIGQCSEEESIKYIAEGINRAHKETKGVVLVIENMAGQGNVVGGKLEHIRDIIQLVEDKSRVGVCLDTCHSFAAGYDLRTKEGWIDFMAKFEELIGIKYLKAMHVNDSKTDLHSCKDRHENLGNGKIGMECFRFLMKDPRFIDMPLILETPVGKEEKEEDIYGREIDMLYQMMDTDPIMTTRNSDDNNAGCNTSSINSNGNNNSNDTNSNDNSSNSGGSSG